MSSTKALKDVYKTISQLYRQRDKTKLQLDKLSNMIEDYRELLIILDIEIIKVKEEFDSEVLSKF